MRLARVCDGRAPQVREQCHAQKFFADVDDGGDTLNKKIRNAQVAQYNFIFGTVIVERGSARSSPV